jgi:hypothetical protein
MRWLDIAFTVSLASGVASLCVLATRSPEQAAAAPAQQIPQRTDLLRVRDHVQPEFCAAAADVQAPRGAIRVATDDGASVTGFSVVTAFPDDEGRPHFGQWIDMTGTQLGDLLDLRRWLRRKTPSGPHYLCLSAWVDKAGRVESRTAWCRLDPAQLAVEGLRVVVPARETVELRVVSDAGRPLPGVLVAVDEPHGHGVGLVSSFAYTDDDGAARFSGLPAGRKWFARLVDGVGPVPDVVEKEFATPRKERLDVVAKLPGDWTFVGHEALMPFPGAAARALRLEPKAGTLASAWLAAKWIAPGRGAAAPFTVMVRAGEKSAEALSATLVLEGDMKFAVADVRVPQRIDLASEKPAAAAKEVAPPISPR